MLKQGIENDMTFSWCFVYKVVTLSVDLLKFQLFNWLQLKTKGIMIKPLCRNMFDVTIKNLLHS